MRRYGWLTTLFLVAPLVAGQPPDAPVKAQQLQILEDGFGEPQIVMLKSMPPQFNLTLKREMPTPGWEFAVDSLDIDPVAGRIVARLTEKPPGGIVAQVVTPAWLRLELGTLVPGRYVVELRVRRRAGEKYRPEQALILDAR